MPPAPHPIRTAVIGFGFAGRIFHSPFIHAVPGLELSAIVQRHGDTAQEAYPSARILRSPEEACSDAGIDLIVVATPNASHAALARTALEAGKHVVVDKPLATSSEDARSLVDLAAAQGKLLAPFHNRRYDADFLTVRKLHRENTLGRIATVISHYDRYRPLPRPNTWKEFGAGNGVLYDLGPHLVDQALALFGPPARITAQVHKDRDKTDIDDAFDITFEYDVTLPDGQARVRRYHCRASMLAADPSPRFRLHGTLGSYTKYGLDPQEAALLKGARPPQMGSQEPWLPEPETAWGTLTLATEQKEPVQLSRKPYPSETGDYRLFYANVRDAIQDVAPLAIPAEDGYRTVRLLDLALESSRLQRTLPVTFE